MNIMGLMYHCVEILRELTGNLSLDPPTSVPEEPADDEPTESPDAEVATAPSMLPEYGDEASLDQARMAALEVFDSRSLAVQSYVALWIDSAQVWGHPLILCMGVTAEGYRNFLGFVRAHAREVVSMQRLFQDLTDRGLCTEPGPLCITSGEATLSRQVTEGLNPGAIQYCQVKKRARVVSYLGDSDVDRIKGAILRAYALPGYTQAYKALMEIHADLLHCNRNAAQWLEQDLDQTLTLHRTGRMEKFSRSLRSTRCIGLVAQKLNQRLKAVQRWLPPIAHRAQIALLLLEMELSMRKLDHASELPALLESTSKNTQESV